jgi:hypothetical protein
MQLTTGKSAPLYVRRRCGAKERGDAALVDVGG